MSLPLLLAAHPDPEVLANLRSQLRGRYAREYRVECVGDAGSALAMLTGVAAQGGAVALVLAAGDFWGANGGDGLQRVRELHPQAKRALLVHQDAWTDAPTAAAIRDAIALGRIHHYVIEPVAGLDEAFHESTTGFLLEWARDMRIVPQTIHVVGEQWSGRAHELRSVLESCAVPHVFCLADSDQGRRIVGRAAPDLRLPLVMMPDGRVFGDPTNAEMAAIAGAPRDVDEQLFDLVIVGAGPAGLSAAVYGASEGLETLVIDSGGIGGQARSSALIRNYLGFPKGVSGSRLAEHAYEQAAVFGARFLFMHTVAELRRGEQLSLALSDGRVVAAHAVILASGASYRRLGVPELERLTGGGVFYGGSASEANALSGGDVYVAGGGNSAGQAALHLARFARRATILIRGDSIEAGMSQYLVREIEATPNVEVRTQTTVVGGAGEGRLESLVLRHGPSADEETVPADALFVLIGARPRTEWLPAQIARDERGFLLTGDELGEDDWPLGRAPLGLETSMPGVLAAGDVRRSSVKRVASAVGEGSIAVQQVHRLLAAEDQAVAGRSSGSTRSP